jgi:hypothetical protein
MRDTQRLHGRGGGSRCQPGCKQALSPSDGDFGRRTARRTPSNTRQECPGCASFLSAIVGKRVAHSEQLTSGVGKASLRWMMGCIGHLQCCNVARGEISKSIARAISVD